MLNPSKSSVLRTLGVLLALCAVTLGHAAAAAAQEAPLRLAFVNSDPDDGDAAYDALREVLEASDDLVLVDEDEFMEAAAAEGAGLETLRKSELRERHAFAFQTAMEQTDTEGLLVIDVFGGGGTMQLVVLGPYGNELADIRESISGGRPNQDQAISVLQQTFKALVPEVRAHRRWKANQQASEQAAAGSDESSESVEDQTIKDRVVAEHRQKHGNLRTGITPNIGAIFGRRSMTLSTKADYNLDHASPFAGFSAEIDAIFVLLDGDRAALGATVFGAYAPFTTVFSTGSGPIELPSAFSNAGVDLKYIAGMGPEFRLYGLAGAEILTINIDQNQLYTGNSYLSLRAGLGVNYRFGQLAELRLDAAVQPTPQADLSGDAMGSPNFALGYTGRAGFELNFLDPLVIRAGYRFQYYSVDWPSPNLPDLAGEPASTDDTLHLGSVMVGYGF